MLTKTLVLHLFTLSIPQVQFDTIHPPSSGFPFPQPPPLPTGLPPSNFLTVLSPPFLTHLQAIPIYVLKYSHIIWRYQFITNFLIHLYSTVSFLMRWSAYFSQYIPFPRHLSPFPLYWTVPTIQHDKPQSVLQLFHKDVLLMNELLTFSSENRPFRGNIYYQ